MGFESVDSIKVIDCNILYKYPQKSEVPEGLNIFVFSDGLKVKEIDSKKPEDVVKLIDENVKPNGEESIILLTNMNREREYAICIFCNNIYYNVYIFYLLG